MGLPDELKARGVKWAMGRARSGRGVGTEQAGNARAPGCFAPFRGPACRGSVVHGGSVAGLAIFAYSLWEIFLEVHSESWGESRGP